MVLISFFLQPFLSLLLESALMNQPSPSSLKRLGDDRSSYVPIGLRLVILSEKKTSVSYSGLIRTVISISETKQKGVGVGV